jgi:argininosuccinate lyase
MALLTTYKALPSTYNKDLQEDKRAMFDSIDTAAACLNIADKVLSTLTINEQRMRDRLSQDMLATDLAEYLVRKGVPFRDAHHAAGAVVRLAESRGCLISELSLQDYRAISNSFDADVCRVDWWDFERSVESRSVAGGTAESAVRKQIKLFTEGLLII